MVRCCREIGGRWHWLIIYESIMIISWWWRFSMCWCSKKIYRILLSFQFFALVLIWLDDWMMVKWIAKCVVRENLIWIVRIYFEILENLMKWFMTLQYLFNLNLIWYLNEDKNNLGFAWIVSYNIELVQSFFA